MSTQTPELARLSIDQHEGVPVGRISGEIDLSNAEKLYARLQASVATEAPGLVVDLTGVRFMDSSGVHLLQDLQRELSRRGQILRAVIPVEGVVVRLFEVLAIDLMVGIDSTVENAVAILTA